MQLADEIRYLLLAVQREGNRLLTEALRPFNLTPAQAEVLRVLQEYQPLSLVALGDLLICEQGSPSRLVAGMVAADLISRIAAPDDRRRITLTLTKHGQQQVAHVAEIEALMNQMILTLIADMPMQEFMALFWRYIEGRPAGEALARRKGASEGTS